MPARKGIAAALSLGVAFTGLQLASTPSASAVSTGLVISEVYGGGGNTGAVYSNDYVELSNPTDAPITVDGMSVQYRSSSNGGTGVVPLTGSVPAGGHYLVQLAAGTTVTNRPLPRPDATGNGVNMSGTAGTVFLASGTALVTLAVGDNKATPGVVDLVGFGTSTTFETAAAPAPSNTTVLTRTAPDGDVNSAEFGAGTTFTPTNSRGETQPPTAPALAATDPGDRAASLGTPIAPITLVAAGGTAPYSWQAAGLPAGVTLTGDQISGTPTATGTFEVTLTVTDSATPTPATDAETFTLTVTGAPEARTIAEIQGTGPASPLAGTTVETQGVVTALYRTGGLNGMFIQTPGPDATPGASDGLFVFGGSGAVNLPAGVERGDSVRVTGPVSEFNGSTQITPGPAGVTELDTPLPAAEARTIAYPRTEEGREAHEGELVAPTDRFTVSNVFDANTFAEIGLATGDEPLVQPTEVVRDDDAAGLAAVKADNEARKVTLDDGSTTNYFTNSTAKNQPLPWLSPSNPVRVGARATLVAPVVLEFRFGAWKLQPTQQVTDEGRQVATFENTRPQHAAPQDVGGDITLATFNVLNYFNTTGEQYVANGAAQDPPVDARCTYYTDREGNRIGNNRCGVFTDGVSDGAGPRGAATTESLARQQAKIVTALGTLDADVVALEEVENSVRLVGETDRDDALSALVAALNEAEGAGTWDYVRSPAEASTPEAVEQQDVIRSAYIFKPAAVEPVGESDLLLDTTEFANAREPLAQAFKAVGTPDSSAFSVVANHFKSKGDSDPAATGDNANSPDTGAFNGDRVRQATRLLAFAEEFATARGTEAVFLLGDFNSYTQEDPMHVLYDGGYEAVERAGDDESYSFSGLSGSLDHVVGNEAAMALVTGSDVWDINASESAAFQYSRYNYNATQFFDAGNPFAASDHNPEIVGLDVAEPVKVPSSVSADDVRMTYGAPATVRVEVSDGATGTVEVLEGSRVVATGTVADGAAEVVLPARSLRPGRRTLTVRYLGDAAYEPSQGTFTVRVDKARARVSTTTTPDPVVVRQRAQLTVRVGADGVTPTGTVLVLVPRHGLLLARLEDGTATIALPRFQQAGTVDVLVTYLGSDLVDPTVATRSIRVVRR